MLTNAMWIQIRHRTQDVRIRHKNGPQEFRKSIPVDIRQKSLWPDVQ